MDHMNWEGQVSVILLPNKAFVRLRIFCDIGGVNPQLDNFLSVRWLGYICQSGCLTQY